MKMVWCDTFIKPHLNVISRICKFRKPDKEFTPYPVSTEHKLLPGYQAKMPQLAAMEMSEEYYRR